MLLLIKIGCEGGKQEEEARRKAEEEAEQQRQRDSEKRRMLEEMREGKRKAGAAACNKMTDGNSGANNGRVNGCRVEATNRHDKSAEDDVTDEATAKQVANASQPLDDHRISDSDETLEHQETGIQRTPSSVLLNTRSFLNSRAVLSCDHRA